jgi:hypothetical protein
MHTDQAHQTKPGCMMNLIFNSCSQKNDHYDL